MMKTAVATAAVAILGIASAQAAVAQTFEVLRAGDSQLTCEALTGEINALNETIRNQAQQAERSAQARATAGRLGRGLLSGLAQSAQVVGLGGLGGSSNPVTNVVAGAAIRGVTQELANGASAAAATPVATSPSPAETPERQRVAHLTAMFGQRC